MNEEADNQQGFADLREGRSRRITPGILQQEQDAAGSETTCLSPAGADELRQVLHTIRILAVHAAVRDIYVSEIIEQVDQGLARLAAAPTEAGQ